MTIYKHHKSNRTEQNRKNKVWTVVICALLSEVLDDEFDDSSASVKKFMTDRCRKMKSMINQASSKNRIFRQRRRWDEFQEKLTDKQFRRYFRMDKECFKLLCERITDTVGQHEFKSEQYLDNLRNGVIGHKYLEAMDHAHRKSTGGFISGEIKLALTLRLLAGGSYMDLSLLFETSFSYCYKIFHYVIQNWINNDNFIKINGADYLNDEDRMKKVACEFSRASNGLFSGAIGAIDGWLVRIKKPTWKRDKVKNAASYYSRKGFYALNIQVVVDRKKRVLYRSILSRGAEHDSSAFKQSSLYRILQRKWRWFRDRGFYFIGDSAYALRSYLLTPFEGTMHGTNQDNYNFFHSSSRICVECAFGEIDMRWGILWKPLGFKLKNTTQIIDACFRLHNFIVDHREEHRCVSGLEELEQIVFDDDYRRFLAWNPDLGDYGVYGGDDEQHLDDSGQPFIPRGRPPIEETLSREAGMSIRNDLCENIARLGRVRPNVNWFRKNNRTLNI
jgi:hypothetical protein